MFKEMIGLRKLILNMIEQVEERIEYIQSHNIRNDLLIELEQLKISLDMCEYNLKKTVDVVNKFDKGV